MITTYQFTIVGNHFDSTGNPVPKLKMTGKQIWTPKAKEYQYWKDHVRLAFFRAYPEHSRHLTHPILGTPYGCMSLMIHWANEKHGDAENIFGSIADALFENDKHLDGKFLTVHSKEGKVEVFIQIEKLPARVEPVAPRRAKKGLNHTIL